MVNNSRERSRQITANTDSKLHDYVTVIQQHACRALGGSSNQAKLLSVSPTGM